MRDSLRDSYRAFQPQRYLQQYYRGPNLAADDADLFRCLSSWLRSQQRAFSTGIDVGCGPTLHNSFALAPYVDKITLADYLPSNLEAIRQWIEDDLNAHDWDPLLRGVLECEGTPISQLDARKSEYRSRIVALKHCDLRDKEPLGEHQHFDLVVSFFCAECIVTNTESWRLAMSNLLNLVAPGGSVFLGACRNCSRYSILGEWFPVTPINEQHLHCALLENEFAVDSIQTWVVPAPDWADAGFDHIVLAAGTKEIAGCDS